MSDGSFGMNPRTARRRFGGSAVEQAVAFTDAVVVVLPPSSALDASALAPSERALVDAAREPRRARELLAGRIAARQAFLQSGVEHPPAVLRAYDGRPRLAPATDGWFVSLAHDGELVVAAVARQPVGVDVLLATRFASAERVVSQRLATGRARPLPPHPPAPWPDAALCWTAWEALGKHDGRGVLPAMQRPLSLQVGDDRVEGRSDGLRLRWWSQADALLCLVTAA